MTTSDNTGTAGEDALNRPAAFDHVVAAARKRLFAIFDEPRDGLDALDALEAGDLVAGEELWLFHGAEGLRRLDPHGAHHGLRGRLVHLVQETMSDDNRYLDALARALRAGALVVALPVADLSTADRVAAALQESDGHSFAYTTHRDFVPTRGEA